MWEENELWIELSWRIDPDGALGIRKHFESKERAGRASSAVDEYYGFIFENSVPGLPEKATAEGLTPLEYMRRYGAFEVARKVGRAARRRACPRRSCEDVRGTPRRARLHARARSRPRRTSCRCRRPIRTRTAAGRSGSRSTARSCAASRRRAGGSSSTRRRSRRWGWPEYALPDLHPEPRPPGEPRAGRGPADPDLPAAGADPHPQRQRQVARRDRAHEPALDPPERTPRRSASRPATSCASRRASATSS